MSTVYLTAKINEQEETIARLVALATRLAVELDQLKTKKGKKA